MQNVKWEQITGDTIALEMRTLHRWHMFVRTMRISVSAPVYHVTSPSAPSCSNVVAERGELGSRLSGYLNESERRLQ